MTRAMELVERIRTRIIEFVKASQSEYAAVFSPNDTGASRLVSESVAFDRLSRLVLAFDKT